MSEHVPGQPMPTYGEQVMPATEPSGIRPGEARIVEQLAAATEAADSATARVKPPPWWTGTEEGWVKASADMGSRPIGAPPLREHQLTCPAAIAPDRSCNCEGPVICPCGALAMIDGEAAYFLEASETEPTAARDYLRALSIYMDQLALRIRARMLFADSLRRGVGDPK